MQLRSLVRPEQGLISRQVFTDHGVYERELEKIFARCWLYLGHVSQIPNDGDFFTTYMGADSVLVTRAGGTVRAFLNSCTHRGMKVCRTDHGNARDFTCPYHGWNFANDGRLNGVPGLRQAYNNELDVSKFGLRSVANLDTFGGLIFATWDPDAPALLDYLGGMAPYLDRFTDRMEGGIVMIGGVQKWEVPCNWKFIAENFLADSYHVATTHASVVDIGFRKRPQLRGYQIAPGNGHGFCSEQGGIGEGVAQNAYTDFIKRLRESIDDNPANRFIPLGHGTVFPNLSFLDTMKFRLLRLSHPRGPALTESHAMCFVDKALSPELREAVRRNFILSFGPSGMFEVEDGEMWGEVEDGLRGYMTRQMDFNYAMGLNRDRPVAEQFGLDLPGRAGFYWSELAQRDYYVRWRELMEA